MKYVVTIATLGLAFFCHADAPIYGYFWMRYTYENPTQPDVEENKKSKKVEIREPSSWNDDGVRFSVGYGSFQSVCHRGAE